MVAVLTAALAGALSAPANARPYVPKSDGQVLAELPAGAHHAELTARRMASGRLDVAVPLAQFYIQQARSTGDLRFLGYAEAVLAPWVAPNSSAPAALVLQATIQQSRHEFDAALTTLDRVFSRRREDPQAWLTRATILRVQGRYALGVAACEEFGRSADRAVASICRQSLRGLNGHLQSAYDTLAQDPAQGLLDPERAWRDSELGEMAVRLGRDAEAERWFLEELALLPHDFYVRAAYADLLLRQHRPAQVLALLKGQGSIEPLLLRMVIAERQLHDPHLAQDRMQLEAAFGAEAERGEPVHRREQARFLLEVASQPRAALAVALTNWQVQREPDDALVLVNAARAVGELHQAAPALEFLRDQGVLDARLGIDTAAPT